MRRGVMEPHKCIGTWRRDHNKLGNVMCSDVHSLEEGKEGRKVNGEMNNQEPQFLRLWMPSGLTDTQCTRHVLANIMTYQLSWGGWDVGIACLAHGTNMVGLISRSPFCLSGDMPTCDTWNIPTCMYIHHTYIWLSTPHKAFHLTTCDSCLPVCPAMPVYIPMCHTIMDKLTSVGLHRDPWETRKGTDE